MGDKDSGGVGAITYPSSILTCPAMPNKNEILINLSRKLHLKSHISRQWRGCAAIPAFVFGSTFALLGSVLLYNFVPKLVESWSAQVKNIEDLILLIMIIGTGVISVLGFGYGNLRKAYILFDKADKPEWVYEDDLQKLYEQLIREGIKVKGRIVSIKPFDNNLFILYYVFVNANRQEIQGDYITSELNKYNSMDEVNIVYDDNINMVI